MATEQTTYKVQLRLAFVGGCDRARLEEMAVDVMEAIDEHTSDAVAGAAASAIFDPPALEVDVAVRAPSLSDLHRVMAEVLQVLEEHAGLHTEPGLSSSYVESARPDEDLVPA